MNIAGCLAKQNMMNHKNGKTIRDSLMVSVFDDSNNQQAPQPASPVVGANSGSAQGDGLDDDIPF